MVESVVVKVNIPIELFIKTQDLAIEDEQDVEQCIIDIVEYYFMELEEMDIMPVENKFGEEPQYPFQGHCQTEKKLEVERW